MRTVRHALAWLDALPAWQRRGLAGICGVLIISLVFLPFAFQKPKTAHASFTNLRQEINITDGYLYAPSGSSATSSAIVQVDPAQYTGATYYFEVVASTTAATNATVSLVDSTGASVASVTVNGTSYARYRSAAFTAPTNATEYQVRLGNESVGKGIIASRIIVLQNASPIVQTETQIEIGDQETYTNIATSSLAAPKYWKYDSSKWDASPTFYAEVTYGNVSEPPASLASSTVYSTAGTFTVNIPSGVSSTSVELIGGGGAGGGAATVPSGGDGGAGGQYAEKTFANLGGTSHTIVVADVTSSCSSGTCASGGDSTWDTTSVVAKGGAGGGQGVASSTGSTSGCVGDVCLAGGSGGEGTAAYGAGGGGGPGIGIAGNSATGAGVEGAASADGVGGAGGAKDTIAGKTAGRPGNAAGGGGGGAFRTGNGGTILGGTGAQGYAVIIDAVSPTATTTIALQEDNGSFGGWTDKAYVVVDGTASSPTRIRTPAFTPVSGRNYRIVVSSGYAGATWAIYNAKIIVDQGTQVDASYDASNRDQNAGLAVNGSGYSSGFGESFTSQGGALSEAQFYMDRVGSPTGTVTANLYTDSGTYPTSDIPGTLLATSDPIDVSTIGTAGGIITFTFSGAQQYAMTNGTQYFITVEYSGGDFSDHLDVAWDSSAPTSPGGEALLTTAWGHTTGDLIFTVITFHPTTLLEPQYLLANTSLASGTGLQNFLTHWDSSDWTGASNTYIHQVDSASGSASVAEVDTSGGSQVSGSVVSSPSNSGVSSAMTMPATGDLDMKATTNNGDIYASRILVDAAGSDTSPPTPNPPVFSSLPNSTTTASIEMTSGTETDAASPPVSYYFGVTAGTCGADYGTGGADSGWQTSAYYANLGLQPNHCYGYLIAARDSASPVNQTSTSTTASTTYTLAAVPSAPSVTPGATTATLTNNEGTNPTSNPSTNFAMQVTATSPTDSTWLNQYVNGSGNPVGTASWNSDGTFTNLTINSLSPNTTYTFKSMARNQLNTVTASSSGTSVLTLPGAPGDPTYTSITASSLTVNWTAPAGGADTYKIERCTDSSCTSPTQIASGVAALSQSDSALSANTTYWYRVRATNATGDGAYSTITSVTTSGAAAGAGTTRIPGGVRFTGGVRLQ